MKYHSTRNQAELVSPSKAVLEGLAPDGGLYVPSELPQIDFASWLNHDYQMIAKKVFKIFFSDLTDTTIKKIVNLAYGKNFDTTKIVPTRWLDSETGIMELWHGPTLAFKDLALQFLPYLMQAAQEKTGLKEDILILTATSGDTGKAAMEGFSGLEHFRVIVFYPYNGVSSFQKRQMLSREHNNVRAIALKGDFDDCQRGVKELFSTPNFVQTVSEAGYTLSSANSINIGRLVPQTVYYINSYLEAVSAGKISYGESLSIVVPTGNFGNILAACYARKMGLPLGKIHLAANQNNVLADFLNSGVYDRNRSLVKTSSPSMDILVASNLERYLYLKNPNTDWIKSLMQDLNSQGKFKVDRDIFDLSASWANEKETSAAIEHVYQKYNYLIDPHTAVAYASQNKTDLSGPTLIAGTASPYKFMEKIFTSLKQDIPADDWQSIQNISRLTGENVPQVIQKLWQLEQDREFVIESNQMSEIIQEEIK